MSSEREFFKYIPKDLAAEIKESERLNKERSDYIYDYIDRFVSSLKDDFVKNLGNEELDSRAKIKEYIKRISLFAEVRILFLKKKKKEEDKEINNILENKENFLEYFLSCVEDPFRNKIYEFEKEEKKNRQ